MVECPLPCNCAFTGQWLYPSNVYVWVPLYAGPTRAITEYWCTTADSVVVRVRVTTIEWHIIHRSLKLLIVTKFLLILIHLVSIDRIGSVLMESLLSWGGVASFWFKMPPVRMLLFPRTPWVPPVRQVQRPSLVISTAHEVTGYHCRACLR